MNKDIPDQVSGLLAQDTIYTVVSSGSSQVTLVYHSGPRIPLPTGMRVIIARAS